jgi:S1-C subfamily serine protease
MPDYGYDQKGTRLEAVSPGSPAEKAGLRSGDVVVEIDGKEVADVQAYSNLLFAKKPGDEMAISWLRDGKRMVGKAVLAARKPED